ncbi:MAG: ChbG/HpnK family deacetylase [Bryobacteraceae bacterium]|nr:ChbG/HpnK family deacetylase [Bryobacteraceae bacterium]
MLPVLLFALALADEPIRLIVQGDDMGAAHAVNLGTLQAYRDGIMRTTNIIVPAPWLPEAVQLLASEPGLEVGIHLALTSEWTLIKWRPLTQAPSLTDAQGYFHPMVRPNPRFPAGQSLLEAKPKLAEVERELRAQIELGKRLVPRVSYMTTHMGFAGPFPEMQALLKKLSAEYGLPIPGEGVKRLGSLYTQTDSAEARIAKVAARLETLEPGTWLMLDHAAQDTPEMRAVHHPGYENVAQDRAAVVALWTSDKIKEIVRRRKIQLVGNR